MHILLWEGEIKHFNSLARNHTAFLFYMFPFFKSVCTCRLAIVMALSVTLSMF